MIMCVLRAQTCKYDQPVTHVRVSDFAASEQHVVQLQGIALAVPLHHSQKLIQTVVGLFAFDQGCNTDETKQEGL